MKHIISFLSVICFLESIFAQESYFQQEVNYTINVTLNDRNHTLIGTIEMEYINHSPDALDSIYIHLWGNAYQSRNTAFARQQLRTGSTEFYFTKNENLGGFSEINFTVDGQNAILELQKDNPDIAILRLPQTLTSGGKIKIATPFTLKIPASFSRLGHVGQSYQITQWFPKPAVYDREGWHPMPYLELGEFYSEFGSFDVSITLPENYIIGATGILQTESEKAFLQKKVEESSEALQKPIVKNAETDTVESDFPRSSETMKTIRYTAENVHDFAWFADKRFYVLKDQVTFASGRIVDTWVMFTDFERNLWKDAINYVNRSVKFYSDLVGEYPYPQATAIQSELSAGIGMEYPMITIIGPSDTPKDLDIVITHEVGHNWFYGILGSNERDHAWIDEGINSYYEKRYTEKYYQSPGFADILPEFVMRGSDLSISELAYLWQARRDLDQAPETTSDEFTRINYLLGAYEKPAMALNYLEKYVGELNFDGAMQSYYEQWKFKHPQPADFRAILEKETGLNLTWLFDGLLYSNAKQDYKIEGLHESDTGYRVMVKNISDIAGPFTLDGIVDDKVAFSKWYDGFTGEKVLEFPYQGVEKITLDAAHITLDVNRKNNHISAKGSKIEPLQIRFLPGPENDKQTQLYWFPAMAWNNYDKFMLGLALYNTTVPFKKFDFTIIPLYSFGTKDVIGLANFNYTIFPKTQAIQSITFDFGIKSFHHNRRPTDDYDLQYARFTPAIKVELGKKPSSNFYQTLQLRSLWVNQEFAQFSPTFGNYLGNEWEDNFIHELSYYAENRRALDPQSFYLAIEQQSYNDFLGNQNYLKASLEVKQTFNYAPKKGLDIRVFAGGFLTNTRRNAGAILPAAFNMTSQGYNDYRYDDFYFGRNEDDGIWSQQVTIRDGGFKNAIGTGFSLGRSNNFIVALNMKADLPNGLPFNLPLKPYFDIGYFDNAMPTGEDDTFQDQLLWSGGIALEFVKDMVGIYFPLINSKNIDDRYAERGSYWNRIAFTLDLRKLNPKELLKKVEF
ncbi:MAG: M1 family metallopeptidase [Saprospiraceae bacterium]|nr:M1 family metallopeptidase [Saprospiraceae bacterium]